MVNTFSVENINAYEIVLGLLKKVVDLLKIVVKCNAFLSKSNTDLNTSTTTYFFKQYYSTILSTDVLDTKSSCQLDVINAKSSARPSAEYSISDESSFRFRPITKYLLYILYNL